MFHSISRYFKYKKWLQKKTKKFRTPGPPPYLGLIPKFYQFFFGGFPKGQTKQDAAFFNKVSPLLKVWGENTIRAFEFSKSKKLCQRTNPWQDHPTAGARWSCPFSWSLDSKYSRPVRKSRKLWRRGESSVTQRNRHGWENRKSFYPVFQIEIKLKIHAQNWIQLERGYLSTSTSLCHFSVFLGC